MEHYLTAIILGIIEGITEFLPISSTGHLIIANKWFNFETGFGNIFNVVIQLGAILSVMIFFREKLNPLKKGISKPQQKATLEIWKKTIIAVIPALILGAIFADIIEKLLFNPLTVAIALIVGGVLLIWLEKTQKVPEIEEIAELSYKKAFTIGLFQCLAMIPGTSRSAATIIGAIFLGSSRKVAAEFSFFLAIPTMFAASSYSLLKVGLSLTSTQWLILLIGFSVSFIVALAVIALFMSFIQKRDFIPFGYYRIGLGIIVLLFLI